MQLSENTYTIYTLPVKIKLGYLTPRPVFSLLSYSVSSSLKSLNMLPETTSLAAALLASVVTAGSVPASED